MSQKHHHIAYNRLEGKLPNVIFMGGFRSDMTGAKAIFLEQVCQELGLGFLRFDYSGHGQSEGKFADFTISDWRADALLAFDELTEGEQIIIGSSMGGWIGMHTAIERKERVKAFIGIAAAPDFTEDLIWNKFDDFTKQKIQRDGFLQMPNCNDGEEPYHITMRLIEDGRKNFLLNAPININCPVRFLHGMADEDVPYQTAAKIAEKLTSNDLEIHLVKNSTHRMSEPSNLQLLRETLIKLL
jgi:pimeloyl-ACP methyl ester carboxylesterase